MTLEERARSVGGEVCRQAGREDSDGTVSVVVPLPVEHPDRLMRWYGIVRFADGTVIGTWIVSGMQVRPSAVEWTNGKRTFRDLWPQGIGDLPWHHDLCP